MKAYLVPLLASGLAFAGPVAAQSFMATAGQTFELNLDSKEGTFSSWTHKNLAGLTALRMTFSMAQMRHHAEWLPACTLQLHGSTKSQVYVQLASQTRQNNLQLTMVRTGDDGSRSNEDVLPVTAQVGQRIELEANWSGNQVTLRIGGRSLSVAPPTGGVRTLSLSGSTSECDFKPIALGRIN